MPPKKGAKGKEKPGAAAAKAMMTAGPPPKPKKPPPPPACFGPDDLVRFKDIFKEHDEENIDKVKLEMIPLMLRKLGFNPKGAEIKQLFAEFLEDDLVDTVEFHEFLFMIEAKMNWGDDFEQVILNAIAALGQDEEETTGFVDMELLKQELFTWGEPFLEVEFVDWLRLSLKDKTYDVMTGKFNYPKFVENMNNKDERYSKEPINFFKLDQKTLAEMAIKKAEEERVEAEKREEERLAREEAKRQKMIADGLLPPD